MKKLMFALACAASVAVLADGTAIDFEMLAGTTDLGNKNDSGMASAPYYFSYERASGSTDGSTIKTYGGTDCLPLFDYGKKLPAAFIDQTNEKYLELSTEGGTLWRNYTTAGDIGGDDAGGFTGEHVLGEATSLLDLGFDNKTIYVDTLVQFTPTEDGTAPTVASADQMAIWLNVDSTDPDAPVTNLCVLANQLSGSTCDPLKKTFKVTNANVVPGQWYRLTVKTIADISSVGAGYPGFKVYLDGKLLQTDTPTMDAEAAGTNDGYLNVDMNDISNGSIFLSLWLGTTGAPNVFAPTFTAVGFKGSGALDDLVVSTDEPNIFDNVGALDFILTFDANVSAVTYTIDGADFTVPASAIEAGTYKVEGVEGGTEVTVAATAKDWYTIKTGNGLTAINEADQTIEITTELAATPEVAGADKLAGVKTADAQAWAVAKGLTIDQIQGCEYAKNAFLMNTDLSAEPGLQITAIEEVEGGWQITVKGTKGDGQVTLDGINGVLKIKTAATLGALAEATSADFDVTVDSESGLATILVTGDNTNFMKATVEAAPVAPAE